MPQLDGLNEGSAVLALHFALHEFPCQSQVIGLFDERPNMCTLSNRHRFGLSRRQRYVKLRGVGKCCVQSNCFAHIRSDRDCAVPWNDDGHIGLA